MSDLRSVKLRAVVLPQSTHVPSCCCVCSTPNCHCQVKRERGSESRTVLDSWLVLRTIDWIGWSCRLRDPSEPMLGVNVSGQQRPASAFGRSLYFPTPHQPALAYTTNARRPKFVFPCSGKWKWRHGRSRSPYYAYIFVKLIIWLIPRRKDFIAVYNI